MLYLRAQGNEVLKVFLNHASEDRALVMPYFDKLKMLGHDPWIDRYLLPGQDWNEEIQRAFLSSDVVLIFMSPRSVKKRGYVQKEIYDALERLKFLLPGDIGAIPLMLEECDVPTHIARSLQYIRLPNEWHKVVDALALAAMQRSIAINTGLQFGPFRVFLRNELHEWSGSPGYSVKLRFPHFESSTLPNTAIELNEYFASKRLDCLLEARRARIEQEPDRFSHWTREDGTPPANFLDLSIAPVLVSESILSFVTFEAGYYAGAAHGFHGINTHNFVVEDDSLVKITIEDFFSEPFAARKPFTQLCVEKISEEWNARYERQPDTNDRTEIEKSFPHEWDTFIRFSLNSAGIEVTFPPYTLGGYAAGSWVVNFSFHELREWLKPHGPHLLAEKALATSLPMPQTEAARWDAE